MEILRVGRYGKHYYQLFANQISGGEVFDISEIVLTWRWRRDKYYERGEGEERRVEIGMDDGNLEFFSIQGCATFC